MSKILKAAKSLLNFIVQIPCGVKILLLGCIASITLTKIKGEQMLKYANTVLKPVDQLEIYRMFTSVIVNDLSFLLYINMIIEIPLLVYFASIIERRYSTVYLLLQCAIQLFIYNLALIAIGYPIIYYQDSFLAHFLGFGFTPLIINFIWQANSCQKSKIQLLFLPIKIPISYVPWIYLFISGIFEQPYGSIVIYCFVGLFQHRLRKRSYLTLPIIVYEVIQKVVPIFLRNSGCYTKIQYIRADLIEICQVGICDLGWSGESAVTQKEERVNIRNEGVNIGVGDKKKKLNKKKKNIQKKIPNELNEEIQIEDTKKQENNPNDLS